MCNLNDFIKDNSAFLLTLIGLLGSCCTASLVFLLKSRCTKIKCCGFICERDVIPPAELNEVTITRQHEI